MSDNKMTVLLKTGKEVTLGADSFKHDSRSVSLTKGEQKVALFPLTSIDGLWCVDGTEVVSPGEVDLADRLNAGRDRVARARSSD